MDEEEQIIEFDSNAASPPILIPAPTEPSISLRVFTQRDRDFWIGGSFSTKLSINPDAFDYFAEYAGIYRLVEVVTQPGSGRPREYAVAECLLTNEHGRRCGAQIRRKRS